MTDTRNMDERDALAAAELTRVEQQVEAQRATLLRQQRVADKELILGFRETYRRLRLEFTEFMRELERKRLLRQPMRPSELRKIRRFETLLDDIEQVTRKWSDVAADSIGDGQTRALSGVNEQALLLVEAAVYPSPKAGREWLAQTFGRLDDDAIARYIGFSSDGQPLGELLAKIAPRTKDEAREKLLDGLTKGQNPTEIARTFKQVASVPLDRALSISRTEILRAYRSASLDSYKLNENVVTGWTWVASLSSRTCSACWSMHGTEHALDEPFASHPKCRCAPAPITKPWAELGFPGVEDVPRQGVQSGSEVFASLPERLQREVLGPTKFEMYRDGAPLENFTTRSTSRRWGDMNREATVAEARAKGVSNVSS